MNYLENYFEDQSEADQIIEEASDKLLGLISEKVKAEIESYKNKFEAVKERINEFQKRFYEQREKSEALEIDLKRTKEELERQNNEIPKVPFALGEKIWWIGNDCSNTVTIKCSTCKGTGRVKTQIVDYGEVEITCPCCNGQRSISYEPAKAYPGYVVRTRITLDVTDDVPSFIYDLVNDESDLERFKSNDRYTFARREIYKTEKEATKAADQETEKRKSEAEKQLN